MSAGGEINSMGTILAAAKAANETARVAYADGYAAGLKHGYREAMDLIQRILDSHGITQELRDMLLKETK